MLINANLEKDKRAYLNRYFEEWQKESITLIQKLVAYLKDLRMYNENIKKIYEKFKRDGTGEISTKWVAPIFTKDGSVARYGTEKYGVEAYWAGKIIALLDSFMYDLNLAIEDFKKLIKQLSVEEKIDIKLYKEGKLELLHAEAKKELTEETKAKEYLEKLSETLKSIEEKTKWAGVIRTQSDYEKGTRPYLARIEILNFLDKEDIDIIRKLADIGRELGFLSWILHHYAKS